MDLHLKLVLLLLLLKLMRQDIGHTTKPDLGGGTKQDLVLGGIPDICHQSHQLYIWRNFRFLCLPDLDKSEI